MSDRDKSEDRKYGGKPFVGAKGRSGPPGNRNAIRHGLCCGKVPPGAEYVEHRCNDFRRGLEDLVLQAKGEITLGDAALVDSATKWTRHELLVNRWLRLKEKDLTSDQLLRFSREIAEASDRRDRAISKLKLDAKRQDVVDLEAYLKDAY